MELGWVLIAIVVVIVLIIIWRFFMNVAVELMRVVLVVGVILLIGVVLWLLFWR